MTERGPSLRRKLVSDMAREKSLLNFLLVQHGSSEHRELLIKRGFSDAKIVTDLASIFQMWTQSPSGVDYDTNDWRIMTGTNNGTGGLDMFNTYLQMSKSIDT